MIRAVTEPNLIAGSPWFCSTGSEEGADMFYLGRDSNN